MKKALLSIMLLGSVLMPMIASATTKTDVPTTGINSIGDVIGILENLVGWIYSVLLILATAYLLWGGVEYVTSSGDETKLTGARNKIKYALIGLGIAAMSNGIISIVKGLVD